jgi:hypothetical protein
VPCRARVQCLPPNRRIFTTDYADIFGLRGFLGAARTGGSCDYSSGGRVSLPNTVRFHANLASLKFNRRATSRPVILRYPSI